MTTEPDPVASEAEVIEAIAAFSRPVARYELERVLAGRIGARVRSTRLATLVRDGRLRKLGDRRWTTYALPESHPRPRA